MNTLHASCLCGAVALTLPDQFDYMGNCHCSECRKFSGADYASVGGLDGDKVAIVKGSEAISRYQKSDETSLAFCRHCGSSLFSQAQHGQDQSTAGDTGRGAEPDARVSHLRRLQGPLAPDRGRLPAVRHPAIGLSASQS